MLRSQGIPARMVVGFAGARSIPWVSTIWFRGDIRTPGWRPGYRPRKFPIGNWPALAARGSVVSARSNAGRELNIAISEDGVANRVAQAFDYVELLWRDYVLSLNSNRQEDLVYDPLTARVGILPSWVESRSLRRFQRWLRQITRELGTRFFGRSRCSRPRAFDGLAGAGRRRWSLAARGAGPGHPAWLASDSAMAARKKQRAAARPPAFYLRLERSLARLPLDAGPARRRMSWRVWCAASSALRRAPPLPRACHRKSWPRIIGFDSADTAWTMRKVRR